MEIKRGIAVSPGVAIGPALVLDTEWFRIPAALHRPPTRPRPRCQRLHQALDQAAGETRANQEAVAAKLGQQYGAIFGAHALMLSDPTLAQEIEALIRTDHFAAEYAVSRVMRRHAKALESIEGGYLADRVADLFDIEKRILRHLLGQHREQLRDLREPVIVLAHDLTPSETATLDPHRVHAFATEAGGRASHTAIVAGVLEIPAVVGLGKFITDVSGGDVVIVDGNRGLLIIDPDDETLRTLRADPQPVFAVFESQLDGAARSAGRDTRRRPHRAVWATSSFRRRARHCLERGAEGVGLYRTEFLYLGKQIDPSEAGAPRSLPDGAAARWGRAAGGHPHPGPGGRQVPAAHGTGRAGAQSVPGFAERAAVSAEFDLVQNANACHSESQCFRRRAHHVSHDQHLAGTAPVQDDPGGSQRGPGGRRHRLQSPGCRSAP